MKLLVTVGKRLVETNESDFCLGQEISVSEIQLPKWNPVNKQSDFFFFLSAVSGTEAVFPSLFFPFFSVPALGDRRAVEGRKRIKVCLETSVISLSGMELQAQIQLREHAKLNTCPLNKGQIPHFSMIPMPCTTCWDLCSLTFSSERVPSSTVITVEGKDHFLDLLETLFLMQSI